LARQSNWIKFLARARRAGVRYAYEEGLARAPEPGREFGHPGHRCGPARARIVDSPHKVTFMSPRGRIENPTFEAWIGGCAVHRGGCVGVLAPSRRHALGSANGRHGEQFPLHGARHREIEARSVRRANTTESQT
jgi:hypothetical protein